MFASLPCSLLLLIPLDVVVGFQAHFTHNGNPLAVGRSLPLLTSSGSATRSISFHTTALFDGSVFGMEGDPLEEDRRQRNAVPNQKKMRFVSPQQSSSAQKETKQQEQPQQRLVRPAKQPSTDNERKATISTSAGVNMELKDPKERKLVRHATASAAYGVDAFKGKKKKIIKPWSSGRKKHKNKQNNTGGIAREAYGEELKVELKSKPKEKRLVMARSAGNQEAAKALISGGSKAKPLTAEDLAEEKRLMEKQSRKLAGEDVDDDDNYYYGQNDADESGSSDDFGNSDDGEPSLVRISSSIEGDNSDDFDTSDDGEPRLVRMSSSIVKEPGDDTTDGPNLVRLTSSIVRPPEDDSSEPNLVRMESSIVREPEKDTEEELKYYTRSETPVEEEEQRLVRAVPMSQPPPSDEPKLVRPNIVKEQVEGPKLVKPNIVKAKVEGPKLVRPNVRRAKPEGPKLVRANVQKEKRPESNLVRPKIIADGMDVGKEASANTPPLVRPSAQSRKDFQDMDFMYGVNASTSSPTSIPLELNPRNVMKPAFTSERSSKTIASPTTAENSEDFMYGSTRSSASPTSVSIDSKSEEYRNDIYVGDDDAMESLMYGAKQATTSPTAVSLDSSKTKGNIQMRDSAPKSGMDSLMYGANKSTTSPTAVALDLKSKKKFVRPAENDLDGLSDTSLATGTPQSSTTGAKTPSDSLSPDFKVMDDLMYGHQRALSSPTAVKVETNPTRFVKRDMLNSGAEDGSDEGVSGTSTTLYPDGDKRKEVTQCRLVRASSLDSEATASKQKRYVKPSTSAMDRAQDWDAANPTSITTNPTFVRSVGRVKKEARTEDKKKRYVQPSTSLMNSAPDWDAVQPATTTANPSVVKVDAPKSKKEVEYVSGEKSQDVVDKPKRKYVQPSSSLMDSAPDWDAVQPATTTSNPSVVNVDVPESKKEVESVSGEKSQDAVGKPKKKKYVQPSTSLMDSAPDWDAVQPAITTSNPSQVYVGAEKRRSEGNDGVADEKPKTKKYVKPSTSLMDSAPDWDAVQPAISTANPSVVNVDGINNTGKEKLLVRPPSSSIDEQAHEQDHEQDHEQAPESKSRAARPADTPFEYKQVQSIPKENPAGAKPSEDEEEKTKLPAAIAHAAGSSSEGWTPQAHFPSDEDASSSVPGDKKSPTGNSKKRAPSPYSTMENYDPDALPRPTGVIPLTVSSSARDKTQLFRAEHSLDPVEDGAETSDSSDEETETAPLSKSKSSSKKLFLYDGSNSQPKELWDFKMEGGDTKLDENLRPKGTDASSGSSRLEEKTVSPFTRNVSKKDDDEE